MNIYIPLVDSRKPAQYFTTWEEMLKSTNVQHDLLTDIDMCRFFQNSIRGGLVQCCQMLANNKYLSNYDFLEGVFIFNVCGCDMWMMCGWAMSQPLPYKDLKWMSYTDINNFDVHYD